MLLWVVHIYGNCRRHDTRTVPWKMDTPPVLKQIDSSTRAPGDYNNPVRYGNVVSWYKINMDFELHLAPKGLVCSKTAVSKLL